MPPKSPQMKLLPLISAIALAIATTSAHDDSVNDQSLKAAVDIANSNSEVLEKRTLGLLWLVKAKFLWAKSLLNQGICYSCGSQNLGCNNACCRCGAPTQVQCSTC